MPHGELARKIAIRRPGAKRNTQVSATSNAKQHFRQRSKSPCRIECCPGVWNALRATKSPVENVFACRPALYEGFETRSMSNPLITSAAISGRGRTRYTLYSTGQTQQGFCRPL